MVQVITHQLDVSMSDPTQSLESPNIVSKPLSDAKPESETTNEIFLSLPEYLPFSNSIEAFITSIFLIPIGIDRSIASVLAKIKGIPKLITNKPIRTYNRTWVIPNTTVNDTPSRIPTDWGLWIQQFKSLTKTLKDSDELDYVKRLESILSYVDPSNLNCIDAFMLAQLNDCKARLGLL